MKIKLLTAALIISAASFGQCIKCKSFTEAAKDPARVTSIIMNGAMAEEELEEIPASIKNYSNLEVLYITDFGLESVPKEIGQLKKLKSLSFAGNGLTKLPEEIFELKQLKELIISDNQFSLEYLESLQKKLKAALPNTKVFVD